MYELSYRILPNGEVVRIHCENHVDAAKWCKVVLNRDIYELKVRNDAMTDLQLSRQQQQQEEEQAERDYRREVLREE